MRRRIRREYTWFSGAWLQTNEVHYIYDGNLVIQERDANNVPTLSYTRGRDLSGGLQGAGGIGGLLAMSQGSGASLQHSFYHADANGNITALANSKQAIVARYLYDPFGNILSKAGPLADANLYRFSSKELHLASGLLCYGYRFYDPGLQRWINRDPANEAGGLNLYGFAANNPVNGADTDGRFLFMRAFYNFMADQLEGVAANSSSPLLGGLAEFAASLYRSSPVSGDPLDAAAQALGLANNTKAVYEASRHECHGKAASAYNAGAYLAGNVFGFTPFFEGVYHVDLPTGAELSAVDSWSRGLSGAGSMLMWALGGADGLTSSSGAADSEGALAGSIRNVNPTGGDVNCVNCSIATEYTLRGAPASALPTTGPLPISLITKEFGGSFAPVSGPMEIGSILSQSGEGASGIVFGQGTSMNHVWNVVNQGGNIRFLDGQIRGLGVQNFENFNNFQFLLTTPGK